MPTLRHLVPAAAAGLGLSLLSALPAGAHGLAVSGLVAGVSHPLLGIDHLLLLLGVGATVSVVGPSLLLLALAAAMGGALFGSFGGSLPAAEVWAALTVSGLGVALLARQRLPLALSLAVATGMAIHAMLHGQEASGSLVDMLGWWLGASLASCAVMGASALAFRQLGPTWVLRLAAALSLGGALLALAPLA